MKKYEKGVTHEKLRYFFAPKYFRDYYYFAIFFKCFGV